ncbi:hypothetical protein [Chitinophaga sp. 212800010-3]|uniref:tetratricopeptide repeat protein n=1 Tax=unclassified Chitinophaga TaxID=2619133 RepID=UPI002DF6C5E2|nr:hypothetical protein [Chitinophaga sp. 212800010-3]
MLGNTKDAIDTYEDGLKRYPAAGNLYLERGVMEIKKEDYSKAVQFFEKGIEQAPMFSSNYYWAARLFCLGSAQKYWGMIYGELFMNLESGSKRTADISKILYDTYKSQIQFPTDTSISVHFAGPMTININYNPKDGANALAELLNQANNMKQMYGTRVYEPVLSLALAGEKRIDLASLNRVRTRFLDVYEQQGHQTRQPVVLFDRQREIRTAGHLEAYNYWLLSEGDKVAFNHWQLANDAKWQAFVDWFREHAISITDDNKFNMEKY